MTDPRASALQFRYLFVTDQDGLKIFDATSPSNISSSPVASVALNDAKKVYVARTYAYVAAGKDGLAIINVKNPEEVKINDDFAKNLGAKDLNDLKSLISKQINDEYKNSLDQLTKNQILKEIEKINGLYNLFT